MSGPAQDAEALIERRGAAGVIVLNRPKALNALTLTMVRLMAAALDAWEDDPLVTRVVIGGAGDKAFCAGGDIRSLYELGRAGDHDRQLTFWREEYQLNERIRTYPETGRRADRRHRHGRGRRRFDQRLAPGRGRTLLFRHAGGRHRIFPRRRRHVFPAAPRASRRRLSRPYRPSRQRGRRARVRPRPDLRSERRLWQRLLRRSRATTTSARRSPRFAAPAPASALMAEAEELEACFSLGDREAILAALEAAAGKGFAFAAPARAAMLGKSPTSQALALRQMALGPNSRLRRGAPDRIPHRVAGLPWPRFLRGREGR